MRIKPSVVLLRIWLRHLNTFYRGPFKSNEFGFTNFTFKIKHCNIHSTNHIITMLLFSSDFPLRFQTGEIPSLGTMEVYNNNTWNKLCTSSWDKDESILTCKAMGYTENDVFDIDTWYNDSNALNVTVGLNCTSLLTNCLNKSYGELQLCKGIIISILQSALWMFLLLPFDIKPIPI